MLSPKEPKDQGIICSLQEETEKKWPTSEGRKWTREKEGGIKILIGEKSLNEERKRETNYPTKIASREKNNGTQEPKGKRRGQIFSKPQKGENQFS